MEDQGISFDKFQKSIKQKYTGEDGEFSWSQLGKALGSMQTSVPSCEAMLGPLNHDDTKRRKLTRAMKKKTDVTEAVIPEEVINLQSECNPDCERIKSLYQRICDSTDGSSNGLAHNIDLMQLVVDETDYFKTIENLHDLSYLVKVLRLQYDVLVVFSPAINRLYCFCCTTHNRINLWCWTLIPPPVSRR